MDYHWKWSTFTQISKVFHKPWAILNWRPQNQMCLKLIEGSMTLHKVNAIPTTESMSRTMSSENSERRIETEVRYKYVVYHFLLLYLSYGTMWFLQRNKSKMTFIKIYFIREYIIQRNWILLCFISFIWALAEMVMMINGRQLPQKIANVSYSD